MVFQMALESLVQRGRSALANDLVTLCQRSHTALQNVDMGDQLKTFSILKNMGFDTELQTLVKKHMNIPIDRVIIVESALPNMYCVLNATPEYKKTLKQRSKTAGMMMEEIKQYYNNREAVFDPDSDVKLPISFHLEIMTAMWAVRNDDHSFFFSPEELAAIILHELGHVDYFIRGWGRAHTQTIDAAEILDYTLNSHNKDTIMALITAVEASHYLDKSWKSILVATKDYFATTNSFDNLLYWEALSTLAAVVAAETSSRNLIVFKKFDGDSAKLQNLLNSTDNERSADEFSARNGMYEHLVKGIIKLYQLSDKYAHLLFRQETNNIAAGLLALLSQFRSSFSIGAEDVSFGYDPIIRRLELVIQTAKHAFSDTNLPPKVKQDFYRQIQFSEQCIEEYRNSKPLVIRRALKQWKDNVGKFGRIIACPFQNRLVKDYSLLQDATRSLSRHPLYYTADRLK